MELHIAEYEALMTRISYLLQVQYAFWPVALVIVAIAAQIWSSEWGQAHGWFIAWGTLASLIVIAFAWGRLLCELFQDVMYIEHKLRPRVEQLVGSAEFWLYEAFQHASRSSKMRFDELVSPIAATLLLAVMVLRAWPLQGFELVVVFSIACLLFGLWATWLKVYRMRRAFVINEALAALVGR